MLPVPSTTYGVICGSFAARNSQITQEVWPGDVLGLLQQLHEMLALLSVTKMSSPDDTSEQRP